MTLATPDIRKSFRGYVRTVLGNMDVKFECMVCSLPYFTCH